MADFKAKGNEAIARKDYGAAEDHYTHGIAALEAEGANEDEKKATLHILYSNRAQARLLIGKKVREGCADCAKALDLQPEFLKSHLRRATLLLKIGSLEALEAANADITTLKGKSDDDLVKNGVDRSAVDELGNEIAHAKQAFTMKLLDRGGERARGMQWIAETMRSANGKRHMLPSQVIVEVIKANSSPDALSPTPRAECEVHYHGELQDGTVFDSSIQRGKPARFMPSQVIRAWNEVMQYMVEGDTFVIWAPPDAAYGARGAGGKIPPYATLKFEIRLLNVIDKQYAKSAKEARELFAKSRKVEKVEDLNLPTGE